MHLANGQTALDVVLFLLAIAFLPAYSIYSGARMAKDPDRPLVPRYWLTIARGVVVTIAVLGLWRAAGRPFDTLGLDLPIRPVGFYCLVLVAVLAVALMLQIVFFDRIVKPARVARLRAQLPDIKILPRNSGELRVFLLVAVMAGIWEELLYRGFLIWFLAPYATVWGAVALSTAAFAIGHIYQGWRGVPRAGLLGLLFAVGYVVTGSLWWLIALHALADIYGGLVAWSVMRAPLPAAPQSA
jgi:membrane protease YdiL (CAAX protease family)